MWISECKGTWRTCDAVTEEAWDVQYSNKYPCFLPCEPPIVVHWSRSVRQRPNFIAFLYSDRSCTHIYTNTSSVWDCQHWAIRLSSSNSQNENNPQTYKWCKTYATLCVLTVTTVEASEEGLLPTATGFHTGFFSRGGTFMCEGKLISCGHRTQLMNFPSCRLPQWQHRKYAMYLCILRCTYHRTKVHLHTYVSERYNGDTWTELFRTVFWVNLIHKPETTSCDITSYMAWVMRSYGDYYCTSSCQW